MMRATVQQGTALVEWCEDESRGQLRVAVDGMTLTPRSEESLRDLYECLRFLFERPAP